MSELLCWCWLFADSFKFEIASVGSDRWMLDEKCCAWFSRNFNPSFVE